MGFEGVVPHWASGSWSPLSFTSSGFDYLLAAGPGFISDCDQHVCVLTDPPAIRRSSLTSHESGLGSARGSADLTQSPQTSPLPPVALGQASGFQFPSPSFSRQVDRYLGIQGMSWFPPVTS